VLRSEERAAQGFSSFSLPFFYYSAFALSIGWVRWPLLPPLYEVWAAGISQILVAAASGASWAILSSDGLCVSLTAKRDAYLASCVVQNIGMAVLLNDCQAVDTAHQNSTVAQKSLSGHEKLDNATYQHEILV
jgi:hypothetical protein